MEQVTDVVFRHVIKQAGPPDLFYTEFANATGWVHAGDKGISGRLVKTDDEQPIVAQIWGGEPGDLEQFAKHCANLGYDGIDINMGCPAKSAVKSGGAALIRQPELAANAIAAAKKSGLPVSVKTRLGYSRVDEWRDWLTHLLQQDIATLTIHLRTKKEMSKVPAHWELIPEIKKLRDEIAPQTLLVINGDIKDRTEGEQLAAKYGVDGIMIGRGIFTNPFAFAPVPYSPLGDDSNVTDKRVTAGERDVAPTQLGSLPVNGSKSPEVEPEESSYETLGSDAATRSVNAAMGKQAPGGGERSENMNGEQGNRQKLIELLNYHLYLYDQYAEQTKRPYETLKRFYKIYIRDFDGASEIRDKLMHAHSTDEVRHIINHL